MQTATADAVIIIKGYWDILANSDEGHSGIKLIPVLLRFVKYCST